MSLCACVLSRLISTGMLSRWHTWAVSRNCSRRAAADGHKEQQEARNMHASLPPVTSCCSVFVRCLLVCLATWASLSHRPSRLTSDHWGTGAPLLKPIQRPNRHQRPSPPPRSFRTAAHPALPACLAERWGRPNVARFLGWPTLRREAAMFAAPESRQEVMPGPDAIAPASAKRARPWLCDRQRDAVIEASRKAERRRRAQAGKSVALLDVDGDAQRHST
jgi:hypothetical protein